MRVLILSTTETFVEYILLGVTPASELSESTFRNLVSVPSSWTSASIRPFDEEAREI
jgi:hypothetical protein